MRCFVGFFRSYILAVLFILVVSGCSPSDKARLGNSNFGFCEPAESGEQYLVAKNSSVKNVIFCIGDGMGSGQISIARLSSCGADGSLYMEKMPVVGVVKTHSANKLITDSAAAGTALACGFKTNNGTIGMVPSGERFETILEAAKSNGKATGLVATSTISHATPASFASHVKSRGMEAEIAAQLLGNKVNVLLGGGKKFFVPEKVKGSARKDSRDLIAEAKSAGYNFVENKDELKSSDSKYLLGLFEMNALTTKEPEPTLAEMTAKAIEVLDGCGEGFFLMVEGSQIDWACHGNDADYAIRQTLLFDMAVKEAIDFAVKDGQTLVIVTADHETGGLTITGGGLSGDNININWSTKGHSNMPVQLFAYGPSAEKFNGVFDNTDVPKKIANAFGIKEFPKKIGKK
ncbi:MAG: alkaline phosphatase [Planctomycetes bacterium]|nr:alkaline phosphatase [Planctomycetota bacterium]MBL7106294.1 alkaline phosphatase [Phycisphaerae bacterium]